MIEFMPICIDFFLESFSIFKFLLTQKSMPLHFI